MSTITTKGKPNQDQTEIASMEAISGTQPNRETDPVAARSKLRGEALNEAKRYEAACKSHDKAADKASWTLVEIMLRILETFERDDTRDKKAFEDFLVANGARPHGNSKSDFHRLAKACTTRTGMKSSRVSKLGGAIAAMQQRGIGSATVQDELKKSVAVKEGGELHSGIHRFFLLYREDTREQAKQANPQGQIPNPYIKWTPDRLKKNAKQILQALQGKRLVPVEFVRTVAALETAL